MRFPYLPEFGPLLRRQFGDAAQQRGEIGLAAEKAHPGFFDRGEVGGGFDGRHPLRIDRPQIGPRDLREDRILTAYDSSFQASGPNGHPRDLPS